MLLLAMGVGVLIGRTGGGAGESAPAAEVVTVAGAGGGAGTSTGAGAEEAFSDDWPSGRKGYTVELELLPLQGTTVATVEQAKTAAAARGAAEVGALKSEDFSGTGLSASSYVVYSGYYAKKAEATKALASLRGKFPAAKLVEVSGNSGTGGSPASPKAGGGGAGLSHPAPPAKPKGHSGASGKKYVEESAKLPDVVTTG